MTWTPPTLTEFRDRFPEFASLADGKVNGELEEAIAEVSVGNWIDRDRTPAVLHLTAHRLSALRAGASGGSGVGGTPAGAVIKAREVGDVRTEFAYGSAAGLATYSDLSSSAYGQRYEQLVRRNFPTVLVI